MKSLTVYHCVRSLLISVLAFTDTQGLLYLCVHRLYGMNDARNDIIMAAEWTIQILKMYVLHHFG